ncbi:MAG: hypothetical protein AB7G13_22335 [Lautropia sp.]
MADQIMGQERARAESPADNDDTGSPADGSTSAPSFTHPRMSNRSLDDLLAELDCLVRASLAALDADADHLSDSGHAALYLLRQAQVISDHVTDLHDRQDWPKDDHAQIAAAGPAAAIDTDRPLGAAVVERAKALVESLDEAKRALDKCDSIFARISAISRDPTAQDGVVALARSGRDIACFTREVADDASSTGAEWLSDLAAQIEGAR